MAQNNVETALGAVVLAAAIGFAFYASSSTQNNYGSTVYPLFAKFRSIDGIAVGADVRVSGVKVGTVRQVSLDEKTFQAKVEFALDPKVQLPDDSSARIQSDGFLGGAHVSLTPGGSEAFLASGAEIIYTQGAINMIDLLGKAVHGGVGAAP